jgi:hypothetical protein
MSRKKRTTQKPKTGQILLALLVIGALISGGIAVYLLAGPSQGEQLRDTDTAFSIAAHVGQPAPEFTALGVDGQPYMVKPGDGRPKAIVFYMGFR